MEPERANRIVLVGGLDPGTGAGLARDLLVATALGARAVLVGTAWTVQDPGLGMAVEPRPAERIEADLAFALRKVSVAGGAVKIGMVATLGTARALADGLASWQGPIVYDPVMRSSSGIALFDGDPTGVMPLARRATLLTPNLDEASWLLGRPVRTCADARAAARALRELGVAAVLLKGGHLEGEATDVLLTAAGESVLPAPRVAGPSPRGTGCALATAIAVGLAAGRSLEAAVSAAKSWLTRRIEGAADVGEERHL